MKKIILSVVSLALASSLSANDVSASNEMKKMADGMGLIMNGLLYNYLKDVSKGADEIQSAIKEIKSHDLKKFLPADTAYAYKFGEKSFRRINEYSNEMKDAMKAKDYEGAFESASLLMRQCNSCHSRVRGW